MKNRVTYSSCLHDQQDLCWGNTSRDTSEELQEPQKDLKRQAADTVKILLCIYLLVYMYIQFSCTIFMLIHRNLIMM